jgi:hypothetical protein
MARKDQEPQEQQPAEEKLRLIDLAREAGMVPDLLPGPKLRPAMENPKAWLLHAVKLRFQLGNEDQLTKTEFNARVAEVSTVHVR